ncbi:Fatty-acid peroxygenase [Lacicoccus alkaliphilus]|uniref:Fatty-acid peroxygenase n=1 Tax=Lacicoccus alkaliphilus DSM 16010 TaxID=1123231 RepID=A0A1M7CSB8_9BACL|nr:fatty-acid peroxygenase [Salinicoccus alkaliphilus DSM 16010]
MKVVTPIPRDKGVDNTLDLIQEGFNFIPDRRKKFGSDIFETRLVGRKAICIAGEEAAEIFYDNDKFKRKGAMPKPLKSSLLGNNGVHEQDGEVHKHRKRMFLSMMTPERLEDMKRIAVEELDKKADEWEGKDEVVMLEEIQKVFGITGLRWAGLPLEGEDIDKRVDELVDMVDFGASDTGKTAVSFATGVASRKSHEKWLMKIIRKVRSGKIKPHPNTALYIVAHHRERDGKELDPHTAAVDLNNAYRPLIAAAYFIAFGLLAIHENPEVGKKLKEDADGNYSKMFTQEVRRYYPFAPAMAAKVKDKFEWKGHKFKKNRLVILDLFGTNRHPDAWENADEFRPERFRDWKESPFSFVPQGGGDFHAGHRCAGEWLTVMVMRSTFEYLTKSITYEVPKQNLEYDMTRIPAFPKSKFIITNVKKEGKSKDALKYDEQSPTVVKDSTAGR